MQASHSPLEQLSKEDLLQHIRDLQEDLRMSQAFSGIPDDVSRDSALHWRGRNRFLAEKIIPVRLEPLESKSVNPENASHRIIQGDNLAVMTSLLAEFRGGGVAKGIDVIYISLLDK